jgi:signal transduction histidine kinase
VRFSRRATVAPEAAEAGTIVETPIPLPDSTNPPSPDRFPIVVVEDDDAIRTLVARVLGAQGYVVHTEASAEKALVRMKGLPAPILVVDKNLPGLTGIDLVETLRSARHDFEAVLMTAHADIDSLSRALHLGVFRCVLKPFHNEELSAAVAGAANRLWLRIDLRARKVELESRNAELEASLLKLHEAQKARMLGERLASIGRLAAGVAHEINTPLSSVLANLALMGEALAKLEESGAPTGELDEMLRDARAAADRVRVIVRDLKTFSRGDEERVGPVAVRPIIEATINMAFNEIRHRARLVKDYGESSRVQANEARLGQVVLNLLLNAAQAIPQGNEAGNEIRVVTRDEDETVLIEVKDTGAWIPPAALEYVFEPFFTTKPIGIGTGLGLSICHSIVTGFGGTIDVDSVVGTGTRVRVHLPKAKSVSISPSVSPEPPAVRRSRVLAVDDDAQLLRTIARVLGRDHDVVQVGGGREALARLSSGESFDAVLCDLMMPDMTGMELHAELSRIAPEKAAAIIFLTGGTFTQEAQAFLENVPNPRLSKPFDLREMRRMVAEALERKGPAKP